MRLFSLYLLYSPYLTHSRNNSLEFVAAPALQPAEVSVDPKLMEQYAKELEQAAAAPLPDDDEADL